MQVGRFWLITLETIDGPWHVGSTHDKCWYIVHKDTGKSKKIGPVKTRGSSNFEKAYAEAIRRNNILKAKAAA